jgi:hypothetical protein
MTEIKNNNDLLGFLVMKMASDKKDWFGFPEQRVTGINLVHEIAKNHADKMTPQEVVTYVKDLNDAIYQVFIKVR